MLALRVLVALGQTEINDVNVVSEVVGTSNEEVIRLDVSVDDSLLVNFLDTFQLQLGQI